MSIICEDLSRVKLAEKLRSLVAVKAASFSSFLIKKLNVGQGGTLPGRVLMAIDPHSMTYLSKGVHSLVVSGTNGKTTTTAMVSHILRSYQTFSNITGANMDFAIAFALSQRASKVGANSVDPSSKELKLGVFEVDEAYLQGVSIAIRPEVIVLLNLSRDQLDRNSEVRMVARRWRDFFEENGDMRVVANCDDPLVTFAAFGSSNPIFVASGSNWSLDASSCPLCEAKIRFDPEGWRCTSCDFKRPEPTWKISAGGDVFYEEEYLGCVDLSIPGEFNLGNALLALAGTSTLLNSVGERLDMKESLESLSQFSGSGGRFATSVLDRADGATVKTYLAKNPAGWDALISTVLSSNVGSTLVMGLNANIADGTDTSWIWDVHFELLASKFQEVVVVGSRRYDLAVRLSYAGITPVLAEGTQLQVLNNPKVGGGVEFTYIGNYTAFFELQRELVK